MSLAGIRNSMESKKKKITTAAILNNLFTKLGFVLYKARDGYHYVPNIYGRSAPKLKYVREYEVFKKAADFARKEGRTNHYYDRLYHLFQAVENTVRTAQVRKENINAVEAGAWKGGSTYFLASLFNFFTPGKVRMWSIDTFEGHKKEDLPPGGLEGKRHVPGLFGDTSYQDVSQYLLRFPFVKVVRGRLQDTVSQLGAGPFHFVHLDMDIAEPTKYGLSFFGDKMAKGGIILVDDYGFFETAPGIERVVEEYCIGKGRGRAIRVNLMTGQCMLIFI